MEERTRGAVSCLRVCVTFIIRLLPSWMDGWLMRFLLADRERLTAVVGGGGGGSMPERNEAIAAIDVAKHFRQTDRRTHSRSEFAWPLYLHSRRSTPGLTGKTPRLRNSRGKSLLNHRSTLILNSGEKRRRKTGEAGRNSRTQRLVCL